MHRTIVGIKIGNVITVPKFSECLLEFFTKGNSTTVNFTLENNILVLSGSKEGFDLSHSPECPIKLNDDMDDLAERHEENEKIKGTNIGVATSVVIESSDSHILLTKRPAHMRSSPNVWVVPGGHVEPGETIFEAAAREVKEETGLSISAQEASVLGLWENVYPLLLGVGTPKYHILIVYLYTRLNETHAELTGKITLDPKEVGSFCWINLSALNTMFSPVKSLKYDGKEFFNENGKLVEKYLDYCSMFNRWLRMQEEAYSGVSYALRKWIRKKNFEKPSSKF